MIFDRLASMSKESITEKIEQIYAPVSAELSEMEERLTTLFDDEPRSLIRRASQYLPNAGGKRIRPALVLLFARATGTLDSDYDYLTAASAVELIHNATLIHDDVVDEAELRRGVNSVNEEWDNKTAVLVGDYLYSRALDEIEQLGIPDVVGELTRATYAMSRGELISLSDQRNVDVSREEYFDIIDHKTASLMGAACYTGAVEGTQAQAEAAREYGRYFGRAFQIVDDIMDLLSDSETAGKTAFKDLEKGKLTLPIIEAVQTSSNGKRDEIQSIMNDGLSLEERRERLIPILHETDGFSRAGETARQYAQRASDCLDEFPEGDATESLRLMCEYVVNRNF